MFNIALESTIPLKGKKWSEVSLDAIHIKKLNALAKMVARIYSRRSAEWVRLVAYVYRDENVPEAVSDSLLRLYGYCAGTVEMPPRPEIRETDSESQF